MTIVQLPKVVSHYNLSLVNDNTVFLGKIVEISLPKVERDTVEWKSGGLDSAVDIPMGIKKMEASYTIKEYDDRVFKTFGLTRGTKAEFQVSVNLTDQPSTNVRFTARCAGLVTMVDPGSLSGGGEETLVVSQTVEFYKLIINNETIYDIDVLNLKRIINGVDEMQAVRRNLGV